MLFGEVLKDEINFLQGYGGVACEVAIVSLISIALGQPGVIYKRRGKAMLRGLPGIRLFVEAI